MSFAETSFLKNNETYASQYNEGGLAIPPAKKTLVVTCMDARVDPYRALGLKLGEAHVVRNAGGVAKDALRNIVISQRLLGTREIAVFHHTGCGMTLFTSDQLKDIVKKETPDAASEIEKFDTFHEFKDLEGSVKSDVQFLQENPLVLKETKITGWVHDVDSGKVIRIV